ncbi:DUF1127 domain-containing protein [Amphritea sp.]|uniref:DUF1127 domain-containing protein n=1 Tax=Amphritea sp. TaxID=1872502 RepID=UPI003D0F1027
MCKILSRLKQYRQTYYSRRLLTQLDARALSDIGLTRAEALREARRPFWDCSVHQDGDNNPLLITYSVVSLVFIAGLGLTVCLSF